MYSTSGRSETRDRKGSFHQVLKWVHSLEQYGDGNNAIREANSVAWLECGKLAVVDTNAKCIKVFHGETGQFEYVFARGRTLGSCLPDAKVKNPKSRR